MNRNRQTAVLGVVCYKKKKKGNEMLTVIIEYIELF